MAHPDDHSSWASDVQARSAWLGGATTERPPSAPRIRAEAVNSTLYVSGVSEGEAVFGDYMLANSHHTHARFLWITALNASDGAILWSRSVGDCGPLPEFVEPGTYNPLLLTDWIPHQGLGSGRILTRLGNVQSIQWRWMGMVK